MSRNSHHPLGLGRWNVSKEDRNAHDPLGLGVSAWACWGQGSGACSLINGVNGRCGAPRVGVAMWAGWHVNTGPVCLQWGQCLCPSPWGREGGAPPSSMGLTPLSPPPTAAKIAGLYNESEPPRKTMRRGVLMTLLQQSAMTLPLWIGKPGDK